VLKTRGASPSEHNTVGERGVWGFAEGCGSKVVAQREAKEPPRPYRRIRDTATRRTKRKGGEGRQVAEAGETPERCTPVKAVAKKTTRLPDTSAVLVTPTDPHAVGRALLRTPPESPMAFDVPGSRWIPDGVPLGWEAPWEIPTKW